MRRPDGVTITLLDENGEVLLTLRVVRGQTKLARLPKEASFVLVETTP